MDSITHLPLTPRRHNAVWVIVDRLTKSAHFLVVWMTFTLEELYRLYIREIVRLHGSPSDTMDTDTPCSRTISRISPIDGWSVREDHTGFRGHAASMCPGS